MKVVKTLTEKNEVYTLVQHDNGYYSLIVEWYSEISRHHRVSIQPYSLEEFNVLGSDALEQLYV